MTGRQKSILIEYDGGDSFDAERIHEVARAIDSMEARRMLYFLAAILQERIDGFQLREILWGHSVRTLLRLDHDSTLREIENQIRYLLSCERFYKTYRAEHEHKKP